ncbi:MAG: arginase family protein [Bdellovibrionota bacterium]
MQLTTLSFVQADIEIGQTHTGLTESSEGFLNYFNQRQRAPFKPNFNLEVIGRTEQHNNDKRTQFFSAADLNAHSFVEYKYLAELSYFGLCKNKVNLNFGGDHSLSLATVEASLRRNPNTLVIWIDAHADLNSAEESLSGNLHGMPVYYLMQKAEDRPKSMAWMRAHLAHEQMVYVGLRDLDHFERDYLEKNNIMHFTIHDLRTQGLEFCLNQLAKKISNFDNVHASFDIDSLDTSYTLCTGVPVNNGMQISELNAFAQMISLTGKLRNLDVVEINPHLAKSPLEMNETYEIALQFIQQIAHERVMHASIYSTNSAKLEI